MRSQLYSRKTLGVKSLSLALINQTKKVVFGLCITSIVLSPTISVHAIPPPPSSGINKMEKRIEGIEKKQNELEQEIQVATKIYDAKWEILIFVLLLLLGGGGAVFFAIYKLLGGILTENAARHRAELSQKLDSEIENKLKIEMRASEMRMRQSHAYMYGAIADGYDPQTRAWRKHLESSIEQSKQALDRLEKLPETYPKWKRSKSNVSNNLAYAMAHLGDLTFREEALKYATYAKENTAEITDGYRWEDTYGWVLLRLARNDDERQEGISYLSDLYNRRDVSQGWVAERREKLREYLGDYTKDHTS